MPTFIGRLFTQLVQLLERSAAGKWLIWAFEMIAAGATWLFRGIGQVILAVFLVITGQQAVPDMSKMNITSQSWKSKYGFTVSVDEANSFASLAQKEKMPDGEVRKPDKADDMWNIQGREFWIAKVLYTWDWTHVDASGKPLKKRCLLIYAYAAAKSMGAISKTEKALGQQRRGPVYVARRG